MNNCVICEGEPKYKCPTCQIYYCSAACCKQHRSQNCEISKKTSIPSEEPQQSTSDFQFPTEDTVPPEILEKLRHSDELKEVLKNPHLRQLLEEVDKCENPSKLMQKAMIEPLFVEFADACLKVVEPQTED